MLSRPRRPPIPLGPLIAAALAAALGAGPASASSVIVKLHSEGAHAVTECAEHLTLRNEPFAPATADRSDSLDRLRQDLGVRSMQAIFRRSDGRPFDRQRSALRQRLAAEASSHSRTRGPTPEPPDLAHVYRVELAPGVDPQSAAARFREDPHVVYAQPNYTVEVDRLLDDPLLLSEGTWGQPYPDQWGVYAIGAPEAWDTTLGEGVVVAVVDTGVDLAHPDIAPNLWVNPGEDLDGDGVAEPEDRNGVDDDDNGFVDDLQGWDFQGEGQPGEDGLPIGDADPQDENGHGTHVAGIAAARGDNGLAIAGVAPRATVMPVRVFPPVGSAEDAVVWRGVLYAGMNGADIVNASFSCGTVCREDSLGEEVVLYLSQIGVAYVTSAGNAAQDVMLKSPERLRESIVVGSLEPPGDSLSSFSSLGLLVDVVAPGGDVLSLAASAAPRFYSQATFVGDLAMRLNGTSMATPMVSGALALLLAHHPELTPEQLRALIRATASDLGAPGHDRLFGAGRLQVDAALRAGVPLDLRGRIDAPLPGDTLEGDETEVAIRGSVEGVDVVDVAVELGRGDEPEQWTPLDLTAPPPPFGPRELARLSLSDLEDGAYVLRLTLSARDGTRTREFTPISVDRNRPVFVSSAEQVADAPEVQGARVVWQSPRPVEGEEEPELDLFVGRFGREGERPLVADPGDQFGAVLSGSHLVWRERAPGTLPSDLRACRLEGFGRCRPFEVANRDVFPGAPRISGSQLVYTKRVGGVQSLETCRLSGRSCEGASIAPEVFGPRAPAIDRRRVVWSGTLTSFGLFTCLLGGSDGCAARSLATNVQLPEPIAVSDRWVAMSGAASNGITLALHACQIDPTDSTCLAQEVAAFPFSTPVMADLSGTRLVWHAAGAHGQPDVYFCELAAGPTPCEPQAITHDAATQSRPRIDGSHVVWLDDRGGVVRVASFELPTFVALRDRRVREGSLLAVHVRVAGPSLPVTFSLRERTHDADALGARLLPRGDTRALFQWRPPEGDAGQYEFVLRATRAGGLYTETPLRVQVRPAPRSHGAEKG